MRTGIGIVGSMSGNRSIFLASAFRSTLCILVISIASAVSAMAQAPVTTLNVTSSAASGAGTLAEAIGLANLSEGPVEIVIASGLQIFPSAQMIIAQNPANTAG